MKFPLVALVSLHVPCMALEAPRDLTVGESFVNPLGFHDSTPVFSWKLPDGVKRQTAWQIHVDGEKTKWDSGWVQSDQSVLVPHGGEPFQSRQRATWRVRYRDQEGKESQWSQAASFEMGLLANADWKASWIRPQYPDAGTAENELHDRVATLRRSFAIPKPVDHARLYVTARGIFDLHLNDQRVGNDIFANGWTSWQKRIDTLTYDVTTQLREGENRIQARLASGWYAGRLGWLHDKSIRKRKPELLLQLEITHTDGSTETIVSDGQWHGTFTGPILRTDFYDGEAHDARVDIDGWKPVVVNPELGPARLTPKPFPTVRAIETLQTKAITEPAPGRIVFDLGQNMVGWPKLNIPVVKDQTITIRFAELLNRDGTLYTENYRSAKSTDTYTAAGTGTIEWQPAFTFHGFRYVELSGFPEGAKPEKHWVCGVVLHSDLRRTGGFESSDNLLNQLQSNITWGQRGNFLDIPTDCPQRDERLGWTGDAQVFAATAMFNYDCHAFFKSWLGSMRDDQHADGRVPNIIPNILGNSASPGWQDAATIIPWEVYLRTGDKEVLAENYDMMKKLVAWYRKATDNGLGYNGSAFGDWLQPHAKDGRSDTPKDLIAAAFHAKSLQILHDSARVLGKTNESAQLAAELASLKSNIAGHFLAADGKLRNAPESQTGYLLMLQFGIVPEALRGKSAAHLARLVGEAGGHLRTGFLGTPYLAPVLDGTGHADLAYGALFKESYPSWFYSIQQGATTMWERWNSYSHEDGFGDAKMNSFNHYAYGAIGQWMYERIAGLTPDPAHPGYKHFFIRPLPGGPLTSARAELETPYGKATSAWQLKDGKLHCDITVPPNTTATIELPGRLHLTLDPGTHRIVEPD